MEGKKNKPGSKFKFTSLVTISANTCTILHRGDKQGSCVVFEVHLEPEKERQIAAFMYIY